jgi:DNA-binding MarR family transcriptional regulator
MAIDYKALADFRHEIRSFLNFSERAARLAKIEPQQHQALLAIKGLQTGLPDESKATIGALAERLQIQHHSAVELSNRLESKGLISRSRGEADRRQVLLRLTLRGERLLRDLSSIHQQELRTAGPRLIKALMRVVGSRAPGGPRGSVTSRHIQQSKASRFKKR